MNAPAVMAAETAANFLPVAHTAAIQSRSVDEASGIATAARSDAFLWVINDSGSAPALHLIEATGKDRGKVTLAKARNVDWEGLDAFSLNGNNYLLAGDTGDNDAKHKVSTLYVLREPALPAHGTTLRGTATIAWRIDYRYAGGPRDCEAVAVDVPTRKILLLSKRTNPPEVHELPLHPSRRNAVEITRRIGQLRVTAPADQVMPFKDQPTGFDIAPDNSVAAVVTYYGVFLFPRKPDETWSDAFARDPVSLGPHSLKKAESVAFSKDGNTLSVISEGRGSPIKRYRRGF